MIAQLDMFAPAPPVYRMTRRPMRLAPIPDECPQCGGGCFGFVIEQDDPEGRGDQLATVCNRCERLNARTERDRDRARYMIAKYGLSAACVHHKQGSPVVPLARGAA